MKFTNSLKTKSDFALHISCSPERISCDTISFPATGTAQGTSIPHDELVSALALLHRYIAEQLDISPYDLAQIVGEKLTRAGYGHFTGKVIDIPEAFEKTELKETCNEQK